VKLRVRDGVNDRFNILDTCGFAASPAAGLSTSGPVVEPLRARRVRVTCVKEDVLEQIVDDYLQWKGYFTIHNVRFRPSADHVDYRRSADAVRSDVDVVGYNPNERGVDRVWVVSCKSWQTGFAADRILAQLRGHAANPVRARWKNLRELWVPKWSEAFVAAIERRTGTRRFTYYLAVTRVSGDTPVWENDPTIRANLAGNPFKFLTLDQMWSEILKEVTTTPASSEIGRLAQLLKAAKLTPPSTGDAAS
jgi:hypothetical protein